MSKIEISVEQAYQEACSQLGHERAMNALLRQQIERLLDTAQKTEHSTDENVVDIKTAQKDGESTISESS